MINPWSHQDFKPHYFTFFLFNFSSTQQFFSSTFYILLFCCTSRHDFFFLFLSLNKFARLAVEKLNSSQYVSLLLLISSLFLWLWWCMYLFIFSTRVTFIHTHYHAHTDEEFLAYYSLCNYIFLCTLCCSTILKGKCKKIGNMKERK